MPWKVAVFGAAGQLGGELVRELSVRGHAVQGFDRAQVDITDAGQVEQVIAQLKPELVINAAAYNQVDVAEREPLAAFQVNALAVRHLAVACRQWDIRLVHFSTDYVFDGRTDRPYVEEDPPHPLSAYAVSKFAGELYAQAYLDGPLIIRTSGVFGPRGRHTARGNFIELMLRLAAEDRPIRVVEDHIASPTYAPALAARAADLIERGASGVFQLGGGPPISWFDYAALIFRLAGVRARLQPTNEREYRTAARRPKYSALSNRKAEALGIPPMPPLEQAIRQYLDSREKTV